MKTYEKYYNSANRNATTSRLKNVIQVDENGVVVKQWQYRAQGGGTFNQDTRLVGKRVNLRHWHRQDTGEEWL